MQPGVLCSEPDRWRLCPQKGCRAWRLRSGSWRCSWADRARRRWPGARRARRPRRCAGWCAGWSWSCGRSVGSGTGWPAVAARIVAVWPRSLDLRAPLPSWQLEEAKASERSLRARLKTLTSELALYKRGRRTPPVQPSPAREDRASSSRERSTSRGRGAARSSSRESGRGSRGRGRPARPSPSPTGGRALRFDPTAFVKAKERKQREIKMKQQQRNRLGSGGSGDGPSVSWSRQTRAPAVVTGRGDAPNRSRNRSSSVDSFRSRCSSASSCSDLEDFSESLSRGGHRRRGKPPGPTPWSGSNTKSTPVERSHQKSLTNSGGWVPIKEYSSDHQAADMAEIDARLKALQEYMNRLDMRS
ncbi:centrosomal protein CCDC61 isoform X9 [Macaca fascicularis]|uniref:centrosomal protein CCDC61 isoform X9 n=1 Tax=Macaca fascicularis TaxID=9541 RepID=UPI003D15D746